MKTAEILVTALTIALSVSACSRANGDWTAMERSLINGSSETMRVLTVDDTSDLAILRSPSLWLSTEDLKTKEYAALAARLVATVTSPEQDGVGIAGPQVGINRRIVAVQRFDKEGEPFEVYPNISITETFGDKVPGAEGCLSVPGLRGTVSRYQDITIKYTSTETLCDTTERIQGFTAVIFQHEADHLVGILYTDKADSVQ